jgi:predicted O-methyltransferase YrrM
VGTNIARSLAFGIGAGIAAGTITAVGAALGLTSWSAAWPVLAACSVLGALLHEAKQSINGLTDERAQTMRQRVDRIRRDVGDIHGLVRLSPYTRDLPLPIGGGWALTGDSAALLAREALIRKPAAVLELGSGVSTLIVGQILKQNGRGRIVSIDHDRKWADITRRYVRHLGLEDVVTVVDAPLHGVSIGSHKAHWYDIPQASLDELGPIDLLVVDGPPQGRNNAGQARYPAMPLLKDRLSADALIFVDDANRSSEKSMVKHWLAENPGWNAHDFDTVDGVCLLTRQS